MHSAGSLPSGNGSRSPRLARQSIRRANGLAAPFCLGALLALAAQAPAQRPASSLLAAVELPNAPVPQDTGQPLAAQAVSIPVPSPTALGTLSGTLTDSDGAAIPNARITLTVDKPPLQAAATPHPVNSDEDGVFSFFAVPAGPYKLSIAADGFTAQQVLGELGPGEAHQLPAIVLGPTTAISIEVTATQAEIAQAQVGEEEKQRVIGVFPNFFVSYIPNPAPLDARQKLSLSLMTLIDPVSLVLNGATAGAQQALNDYSWGQGAQGYAKRFAAAYGDFLTSDMIGNAALPILFHQDPRYFYKGIGPVHSRIFYAIATSVTCKGDNHRWQPNYSGILGGLASAGIANLYYPRVNRDGVSLTLQNAGIGVGVGAVYNLLQEFLVLRLTPHIPPFAPPAQ